MMIDKIQFMGSYVVEHIRDGKIIETLRFNNAVTTEGKNVVLDGAFRAQTIPATWYIGIMDNAGYTATNVSDTMSNHTGWAEFTTYSEAVRQTWVTTAAANAQITNTVALTYNITATGTLRGLFVTSDNAKAGVAGVLWSAALFPSVLNVVNGDQVKITYTVAA